MIVPRLTRRSALKFAGIITLAAHNLRVFSEDAAPVLPRGYGRDPILRGRVVTWSRTLDASQLAALAELCDLVLPADPPYPSAATLGVHDFLDEWVSAPYPEMRADRTLILDGLAALDSAATKVRAQSFTAANRIQQTALLEEFCILGGWHLKFCCRSIELICGGYYTTRTGSAALGYVGNVPTESFTGPSLEILQHFHEELSKLDSVSVSNPIAL